MAGILQPNNMAAKKMLMYSTEMLDSFEAFSRDSTRNNIETIALLLGSAQMDMYIITHLYIPEQAGTDSSCSVTDAGYRKLQKYVMEENLIQLGWIHTHPSWNVFLSSTDEHMQYNHQLLLPEMVAFVVNPSVNSGVPQQAQSLYGAYTLTDKGMDHLAKCSDASLHHLHPSDLYKDAAHCYEAVVDAPHIIDDRETDRQLSQSIPTISLGSIPWRRVEVFQTDTGLPIVHFLHAREAHEAHVPASSHKRPAEKCPSGQPEDTQGHAKRAQTLKSSDLKMAASFHQASFQRPELGSNHVTFDHQYLAQASRSAAVQATEIDLQLPITLLSSCASFISAEHSCAESIVLNKEIMRSLCQLENSLINVSTGGLSDGFFYASSFLVDNKYLYTRYINDGVATGSFSAVKNWLEEQKPQNTMCVNWQVMTSTDLHQRAQSYTNKLEDQRKSKGVTTARQTGRKWRDTTSGGKNSVEKSLGKLLSTCDRSADSIQLMGIAVVVFKKDSIKHVAVNPDASNGDLLCMKGLYEVNKDRLCDHLRLNRQNLQDLPQIHFNDFISGQVNNLSFSQQETVINSLPNDSARDGRSQVHFSSYFSVASNRNKPTSTRNLILYAIHQNKESELRNQLTQLFLATSVKASSAKLKGAARTKSFSEANDTTVPVPDLLEENLLQSFPSSNQNQFVIALLEKGTFSWRRHDLDIDEVIMSDVDLQNGHLLTNSFVTLTRRPGPHYICSCSMYNILEVTKTTPELPHCMHIQFFLEHVENRYASLFSLGGQVIHGHEPLITKRIKQGMLNINLPVVRLDNHKIFHRLSVITSEYPQTSSVVNLEKNTLKCTAGHCLSRKGHTRKVARLGSHQDCSHLQILHQHQNDWSYLVSQNQTLQDQETNAEDVENADDGSTFDNVNPHDYDNDNLIEEQTTSQPEPSDALPIQKLWFNQEKQVWECKCVSKHTPLSQDDPVLVEATNYRLSINKLHPDFGEDDSGYLLKKSLAGLQPFQLLPKLEPDAVCSCGDKYWNDEKPDGIITPRYKNDTLVYLQNGIARYRVYDRECLHQNPRCRIFYSGDQDGIHILTSQTAAGDELGWGYRDLVMNSQFSISCYQTFLSNRYKASGCKVPFMSRSTLSDWLFSWMVSFRHEFREQCELCGSNPKCIAGDGTLLGIYFRNSSFSPMETPDCQKVVVSSHRRTDRQFFSYSKSTSTEVKRSKTQARHDLNYFLMKLTNNYKPSVNESDKRSEEERKQSVLNHVSLECKNVFHMYMTNEFDQGVTQALSEIVQLLVTQKPVSSLIKPRFIPNLRCVILSVGNNDFSLVHALSDLPEIQSLYLSVKLQVEHHHIINNFVSFLVDHVENIHEKDGTTPAPHHEGMYNPAKGEAYYFTPHGKRVRHMPKYVEKDDKEQESCTKNYYAESSRSGNTYLFLMFCPFHGHCYGFHMINNEGSKDAFAPPFLYMQNAPEDFFYDNSCKLEEYALNRQPEYWKNTRFWHDVFHGYSHKCPFTYNSRRITSLHGANTSICEQFNSFIKKIKMSGRSMTQNRFIFYLQFFIHEWNLMKKVGVREAYEKAQSWK